MPQAPKTPQSTRPALALLHGFTSSGESWNEVRAHLPPDQQVWAPNLPGHGPDLDPAVPLPADFAATVKVLAESLGDAVKPPVHLAGYSMGARLALALALEYPQLVSRLTLIGARPGIGGHERSARALVDDRRADFLESNGVRPFIDQWEMADLFTSQARLPEHARLEQRRRRLASDATGLGWALRALSPARMPDYRSRLGELAMPVTLVVGELDVIYTGVADTMLDSLTNGDLVVVPDSGHNPTLEAPKEVADVLARF